MGHNIVLIGMPCAGKSTVGVLLAKTALLDFVDTDLLIQNRYKSSLSGLIDRYGTEEFLRIESEVISSLDCDRCVISTGGSAVYGDAAMRKLRENGITVYLSVPLSELESRMNDIKTRGVIIKDGATLGELLRERAPLYEMYADFIVECGGMTPERCVSAILDGTEKLGFRLPSG